MESAVNQAILRGSLASPISFSHANHGKQFYRFLLEVPRLSGTADLLPIIAEEALIAPLNAQEGDSLFITGQVRSHNTRQNGARHLLIFIFAGEIEIQEGDSINSILLEGILCREPNLRRTPMGRDICDLMIAVPRAFQRADYLPCILWGRTAMEAEGFHTRHCIRIDGRLQSRTYTKLTEEGPVPRTAYEVSAMSAQFLTD